MSLGNIVLLIVLNNLVLVLLFLKFTKEVIRPGIEALKTRITNTEKRLKIIEDELQKLVHENFDFPIDSYGGYIVTVHPSARNNRKQEDDRR